VKAETSRFGSIEVDDAKVIDFPEGLPGFESRRFTFLHDVNNPIVQWLQSLDEPEIAVMTIDPVDLLIEYEPKPKDGETRLIRPVPDASDELIYRVIIQPGPEGGTLLVNLFAPVYVNVDRRLGMQVPLVGSGYSAREVWPPKDAV
jgi:flagellar assembly factor FliW